MLLEIQFPHTNFTLDMMFFSKIFLNHALSIMCSYNFINYVFLQLLFWSSFSCDCILSN